jgi:hypothetical protein
MAPLFNGKVYRWLAREQHLAVLHVQATILWTVMATPEIEV